MLDVTAVGMITSVGWDAPTACASIRAGLSRPAPVDDFEIVDMEAMQNAPLMGHPIVNYTDGFVMLGRWHRLFDGAVESLWATGAVPPPSETGFWRDTRVMVVLSRLSDRRFGTEEEPEIDLAFVYTMVARNFGRAVAPEHIAPVAAGRVGMATAVEQAQQWIVEGRCPRVLIAAADSYLDPMTLEWLATGRRLRNNEKPAALSPGEAGACLVVEHPQASTDRGATVVMRLAGVGRGRDCGIYDEQQNAGRGLANAARQSLEGAGLREPFAGDIITDLNGETWRATEYGCARVVLGNRIAGNPKLIIPAMSLGDVGSASAAVGLCVAARSFVRRYASGQHALVLSSTERGESAAFVATAAA